MDPNLTDEERLDLVKKWWKENGGSIITGVVLGLAVLFGGKAWFAYQDNKAEAASDIYTVMMSALETGNTPAVRDKAGMLLSDYSATPYATLAALTLARVNIEGEELSAAQSHLQWVLDNSKSDIMRDMARLRMARVLLAMDNPDAAQAILDQAPPLSSFDALYSEMRGDIDFARGDKLAANKAYQSALAATDNASPGRHLLQLKYDSTLVAASAAGDVE
jgi:predicted negative regulator of RcsB-dependent stress response